MEENNVDFSQFVEKVLSRVDVVNVISRYIPLNKKGKTFWGCCPFHHEKTPSFAVNEERQFIIALDVKRVEMLLRSFKSPKALILWMRLKSLLKWQRWKFLSLDEAMITSLR